MPYLTNAEYLERFTEEETAGLTDPSGEAVDESKVVTAIQAASDFADSYVGTRYSLPLNPAPAVLKDIVADLARERLFTMRPVEEVTARADRARTALKDIARGVMALVAADVRLEGANSDEAAVYAPERVFTDSLLGSFRGLMQ